MVLTGLSIKRPVMMTMVIMAFVIFGIIGFMSLPIDLMPDIDLPFVTVRIIYPGAGPEEIETAVLQPIEEQMATIADLKDISSFASEGVGFIILEFNLGADPDLAAIDVKDKIDEISFRLPSDMQTPVVGKFDINAQSIVDLAVTGTVSADQLRSITEREIKDQFTRIAGVATVSVTGGRQREIKVLLNKHRADALNINLQTVAGIIAAQTANIPGGQITGDRKEFSVRVQGQYQSLEEIRTLGIPTRGPQGVMTVPLYTFADVVDDFEEHRRLARFNGKSSVGIAIQKRPDANTVRVADEIFEQVEHINRSLPEGIVISVAQDRSDFIRESVNDMYRNMLIGMILTAVMLLLFLGDWRVTIIAAATIPASIIITLAGISFLNFTLNIMTLMALAISIGTLVTNAIIVLENIVRHRDMGQSVKTASETGANEVATAVLASVLTNVAVFAPIATMEGITGQFFIALGLTIVIATIVSLFLSFTLAPLMASRILRDKSGSDKNNLLQPLLDKLSNIYGSLLNVALDHKIMLTLGVIALLFFSIFVVAPQIGTEFFPQADQGVISVSLEMPSGTSLKATDRALSVIEERVSSIPEMQSVYASLGGDGTNTGVNFANLTVQLKNRSLRTRNTAEISRIFRSMLADIPDASIVVRDAQFMGGGSSGDISVEITGDEMEQILAYADSVIQKTTMVEGLVDVQLSWKEARPEIKFIPRRMLLDEYGTNVASLGMALRGSLTGNEVAVFREQGHEYPIRLLYAEEHRADIDAVENISIPTGRGIVPIKVLSDVITEGGAANINRKNRQRLVTVSVNVASGAVGTRAAQLSQLTDQIQLMPGYTIHYGGEQEMMAESFRTLLFAILIAVLLTYMVLAGSIESFTQPFIIMATLPLGLIGVLWALFLTGNSISMLSLMSMVMLIGVVVNNAILIIDYAHKKQKDGASKRDAIFQACKVKFNAILMMNMAVILALLPQALAAESVQAPFAITAIGGIAVSMCMTLFVVPGMYLFSSKTP